MYARCGMLKKARKVLEELHLRDVIAWSTLIAGYAQQGQGHEPKLRAWRNQGVLNINVQKTMCGYCIHTSNWP